MPTGAKPHAQDEATHQAIVCTFAFLKRRGVDQNAVAQRLDIGHQLISMVKNGKRLPGLRLLNVLWVLTEEALSAGPLNQQEFLLLGQASQAWQEANRVRAGAMQALQRQVMSELAVLQAASEPSAEDIHRITVCANELLRLGFALRQLVKVSSGWQNVGRQFTATWPHRSKRPEIYGSDTDQKLHLLAMAFLAQAGMKNQ